MSNNDLRCSKGKSQHHPMDCPLEEIMNKDYLKSWWYKEVFKIPYAPYTVTVEELFCLGLVVIAVAETVFLIFADIYIKCF